jgi:hypothetical protein
MWTHEQSIEIDATPAQIWAVFAAVHGWSRWNAGIERIELHGPFVAGSSFTMQPPGTDAFVSTLIAVDEARGFTDETVIDETRVVVDHRIEALSPYRVRVTYATQITGPEAQAIGPEVTDDFGDVLRGLKAICEQE